ncbi:CCA tRNA nucleotidyltransferase [Jannaschia marina]|uniref:CCA tRNA nucleotidyltransferase n=1 Tax=Jannaschia marina TaxID=2741674 RepID=UPI0015CAC6ED|nr:CCA tRNA nucleotidyltransferase [Jannaschia marina]
MKLTGEWLTTAATQAVFAMLSDAGHRALAVGGCVRNALLDAPVSDIDIATDATPERVIALAEAAGLKAIPTGLDHGTVTVVSGGLPHEITTFRRDEATDGRHATVAFTTEVAEDAGRRDFTMNALYAEADGTVVDPLHGLPDLQARHVRFIRDPEERIREDYLRILRFFRFTAWYGDPARGLDAEGLAACAALAEGLERISAERIGAETCKLLAAPDPAPVVAAMAQAGILQRILPGADATALPVFIHMAPDADWLARLALLGGDAAGLRLSRADAKTRDTLFQAAREDIAPFALGDMLGLRAVDALLIRAALMGLPPDPAALTSAREGNAAQFPLRARDLMPDLQGAALGAGLDKARSLWRAREGEVSKTELIAAARA